MFNSLTKFHSSIDDFYDLNPNSKIPVYYLSINNNHTFHVSSSSLSSISSSSRKKSREAFQVSHREQYFNLLIYILRDLELEMFIKEKIHRYPYQEDYFHHR